MHTYIGNPFKTFLVLRLLLRKCVQNSRHPNLKRTRGARSGPYLRHRKSKTNCETTIHKNYVNRFQIVGTRCDTLVKHYLRGLRNFPPKICFKAITHFPWTLHTFYGHNTCAMVAKVAPWQQYMVWPSHTFYSSRKCSMARKHGLWYTTSSTAKEY